MVNRSVTGKILSYIDAHPDQDLTLERLAEELHYSKFYMARTFKADTGMTLCKYIQGRRLETAARELAETNRTGGRLWFPAGICQGLSPGIRMYAPDVPKSRSLFCKIRQALAAYGRAEICGIYHV